MMPVIEAATISTPFASVTTVLIIIAVLIPLGLIITLSKKVQKKINNAIPLAQGRRILFLSSSLFILTCIVFSILSTIPQGPSFTIQTQIQQKHKFHERRSHKLFSYEIICTQLKFKVAETIYAQLQPGDKITLQVVRSMTNSLLINRLYIERNHKELILL